MMNEHFQLSARFPSNIALVKYWGKKGNQLPCNPSISLTLSQAFTEIELVGKKKSEDATNIKYLFENQENKAFCERIVRYAESQPEFQTLLREYSLEFSSKNSFPHSAGIASSASAFATIAAVLLKAAQPQLTEEIFKRENSRLARLGSGSACRSIYGEFALWGEISSISNSSDEFAVPLTDIHPNFQQFHDSILIVEDEPKKVSSSVGHALMNEHPYATARFEDARKHTSELISILKNGDYEAFISLVEREALSLHAMMMTSNDYYLLVKPQTIAIINKIFAFRDATKLPVCFTLEAGPNIHLLYPDFIKEKVNTFVQNLSNELKNVIFDQAGEGGVIF